MSWCRKTPIRTRRERALQKTARLQRRINRIAKLTNEIVDSQVAALPTFSAPAVAPVPPDTPEAAVTLLQTMHALQTVCDLAAWWTENAAAFREAWSELVGKAEKKKKPRSARLPGKP